MNDSRKPVFQIQEILYIDELTETVETLIGHTQVQARNRYRREAAMGFPSLTKELFEIDIYLTWKNNLYLK